MRNYEVNGKTPKVGDVIFRYGSRSKMLIITGFTDSGNLKVSATTIPSTNGKAILFNYGYLVSADYVIVDTPCKPYCNDIQLEAFNEKRKELGLDPLKRYGDS